ncbi:MAG TPA: hypothetical protein DEQ50_09370 [Lactobacillus sp.]|nr:hypothetical protein [Lactobacillus sp.]
MFDRILVAIDGSKNSYDGLKVAIDVAKKFNSELYLVSDVNTADLPVNIGVSYEPGLVDDLAIDMKKDLQKGEKIVANANLTYHVQLLNGEPRSELINFSKDNEIDLIVMGRAGRHSIEKMFIGSVTRYVSEHSQTKVLVVD